VDAITRVIDTLNRSGLGGLLGLNNSNTSQNAVGAAGIGGLGGNQLIGYSGLAQAGALFGLQTGQAIAGGVPVGDVITNNWNLAVQMANNTGRSLEDTIRMLSMMFGGGNR
jgi:hypothetical protein